MTDKTYNGWTNYATWRVKLELFDYADPRDFSTRFHPDEAYNLGHDLKEYAEQLLADTTPQGLALDYAYAFLSEVNWHEIAEHLIEDYISENEVTE